jgi:hypothetical protein
MSEWIDLRQALQKWPYDAEHDARVVPGDDGRQILQVRTPLGIEQYELEGRPDGQRPHGVESVLEYYERQHAEAEQAGREGEFELNPRECSELFSEGTLYYFRYVRLFQLKDWARTVRDTARNLRAFDFLHRHAQREEDQQFLEKWRPYILRVNACAAAMLEVERNAYDQAVRFVNEAVQKIEALEEIEEDSFKFERERSLLALRELAQQIQKNRPLSELERLEHQLRRAIERQEFERAAELRDRLRELRRAHIC